MSWRPLVGQNFRTLITILTSYMLLLPNILILVFAFSLLFLLHYKLHALDNSLTTFFFFHMIFLFHLLLYLILYFFNYYFFIGKLSVIDKLNRHYIDIKDPYVYLTFFLSTLKIFTWLYVAHEKFAIDLILYLAYPSLQLLFLSSVHF